MAVNADLADGAGLEASGGMTVTDPLGGTYTVSLSAAIAKLGEPIAQGGAGISFAVGTPGSAVVSINAENEVNFSISDAQGRSLMSGVLHPHDAVAPNTAGSLLTWSCNVPDTMVVAAGLPTEPLVLKACPSMPLATWQRPAATGLVRLCKGIAKGDILLYTCLGEAKVLACHEHPQHREVGLFTMS